MQYQSMYYVAYVGVVELQWRNLPLFVGKVCLTVLTRSRERVMRSFRTIGRVGRSEFGFLSQSEIIVW